MISTVIMMILIIMMIRMIIMISMMVIFCWLRSLRRSWWVWPHDWKSTAKTVKILKSIIKPCVKMLALPIRSAQLIKCEGCMKKMGAGSFVMQCTTGCVRSTIWREFEHVLGRYIIWRLCCTPLLRCAVLWHLPLHFDQRRPLPTRVLDLILLVIGPISHRFGH